MGETIVKSSMEKFNEVIKVEVMSLAAQVFSIEEDGSASYTNTDVFGETASVSLTWRETGIELLSVQGDVDEVSLVGEISRLLAWTDYSYEAVKAQIERYRS